MSRRNFSEDEVQALAAEAAAVTNDRPRYSRSEVAKLAKAWPQFEWRSLSQRAEDLGVSVLQLQQLEAIERDPREHGSGVVERGVVQSFGTRKAER